ncbi:hypothetical protein FEMY_20300 [Ferrovum myxofaciens]|uniref:Uncharacterized protein n=1 Tax=Ferrovum myxofaciens TaxID=416213 RepID=A0A149VW96_9PROT|nr:hypothetical protein FEMY_20300 [Ferrovum myxofaciens]
MLGEQQGTSRPVMKQSAQKSGIARGDRVIYLGGNDLVTDIDDLPDRFMHHAHRPEIIGKGGIRGVSFIVLGDHVPGHLAVQELCVIQSFSIFHLRKDLTQEMPAQVRMQGISQCLMEVFHFFKSLGIPLAYFPYRFLGYDIMNEKLFVIDHMVRQGINGISIILGTASHKYQRKRHIGKLGQKMTDPG